MANDIRINNQNIYNQALKILRSAYGDTAEFREHQYEAIESVLINRRALVVEKTGWGKSLVYFTAARILSDNRKGLTLVISPLLVLMDNQIAAASAFGLSCTAINSETADIDEELGACRRGEINLLFTTPEQLVKDKFRDYLRNIPVALIVVDEVHCISDWGHDFRQEYMRIKEILALLPSTTALLATTATANDRVVNDIHSQLNIEAKDIFRGSLTRESLAIFRLNLPTKIERYAWLLENLNKIPGSGIIYCLTTHDCDMLARFLNKNGISAMPYHSNSSTLSKDQCSIAEDKFRRNEIKALVATVKLGMGYDKGDIAFVIHFQQPSNIVSYYQQIGRAGRNIPKAYAILMCGQEDKRIQDHFIETAFPTEEESRTVYNAVAASYNGLTNKKLASILNFKQARIDKALEFMLSEGLLQKQKATYYTTAIPYRYRSDYYNQIKSIRYKEQEKMRELTRTNECLSRFIVNQLDDHSAKDCGRCQNCIGKQPSSKVLPESCEKAAAFCAGSSRTILPRKIWVNPDVSAKAGKLRPFTDGLCLSKYGDPGIGERVSKCKYNADRFDEYLVNVSVKRLMPFVEKYGIKRLTYVPSLRSEIVKDFTERLAAKLGLPCVTLLTKTEAPPQKEMNNTNYQCSNAWDSFHAVSNVGSDPVIIIDDIVDSKWTFTVCAHKLMTAGCSLVMPFALADTSNSTTGA